MILSDSGKELKDKQLIKKNLYSAWDVEKAWYKVIVPGL